MYLPTCSSPGCPNKEEVERLKEENFRLKLKIKELESKLQDYEIMEEDKYWNLSL